MFTFKRCKKCKINQDNNVTENLRPPFARDNLGEFKEDVIKNTNIFTYYSFLNQIFSNPKIKNIALTGDLGIGKSSILKSYEKDQNKSFLYISTSDLRYILDSQLKNEPLEIENIQSEIEKSILQQLISFCHKKHVPASIIGFIPETIDKYDFRITIPILICELIGVILLYNNLLSDFIPKLFIFLIWLILIISISSLIGYVSYKLVNYLHLSKAYIKASLADNEAGAEMEVNGKYDFDNIFFEIIYILEELYKNGIDAIIIEDLDRFDAHQDICIPIITKLKQINSLLENRNALKKNKSSRPQKNIKFIYVLKDNIFHDEIDPFKFFDIIIPIIPVIGYHNSKDFLESMWKPYKLDSVFLKDISPFLTDFRKINNITNEFIVFKSINSKITNYTELMAFIIYKNFFSDDYYRLREIDEYHNFRSELLSELYKRDDRLEFECNMKYELQNKLAKYMSINILDFIGITQEELNLQYAKQIVSSQSQITEVYINELTKIFNFYQENNNYNFAQLYMNHLKSCIDNYNDSINSKMKIGDIQEIIRQLDIICKNYEIIPCKITIDVIQELTQYMCVQQYYTNFIDLKQCDKIEEQEVINNDQIIDIFVLLNNIYVRSINMDASISQEINKRISDILFETIVSHNHGMYPNAIRLFINMKRRYLLNINIISINSIKDEISCIYYTYTHLFNWSYERKIQVEFIDKIFAFLNLVSISIFDDDFVSVKIPSQEDLIYILGVINTILKRFLAPDIIDLVSFDVSTHASSVLEKIEKKLQEFEKNTEIEILSQLGSKL